MTLYGAIEAGGTKFVCAVGTGPDDLRARTRIETTTPQETLGRCIAFFRAQPQLDALGVACFGPIELHEGAPHYGHVTTTPKPGWANTDVVGPLRQALAVPVGFDTDVNGAVLGEACWGAARDLETAVYITIGTGIGGGALIDGQLVHGLVHPEMGHLLVPRELDDREFTGVCRFTARAVGRGWRPVPRWSVALGSAPKRCRQGTPRGIWKRVTSLRRSALWCSCFRHSG